MNILFLTLLDFESLNERNIYTDLLRQFQSHNHRVYVVSPVERRKRKKTYIVKEKNTRILKLKIGNMQKTNLIEKGVSTVLIEPIFISGIKKYFSDIQFDKIIYSTPPITFYKAIEYVKKRDNADTYLLLKDIFPQNAIDIGLLSKKGIKGIAYKYFRKKEKRLYDISDRIGCMSQANVDYVLKHNLEIDKRKVEICPNCVEIIDMSVDIEKRNSIRKKYGVPIDKKVFVYGGNLGKPQGIDFLLKCLKSLENNKEAYFLIIGDGTEYEKIRYFVETEKLCNIKLMKRLPKDDYDTLVGACDVGTIFLDYRFTIPNFPSRLLSYMQAKIPVLACTDFNTDIGKIITDGEFGWWSPSNSIQKFECIVEKIMLSDTTNVGIKGYDYLLQHYSARICANIIMDHM